MKSLPRVVIFGDPKKGPVAEAIAGFKEFAKEKAEVVAVHRIEDFKDRGGHCTEPGTDGKTRPQVAGEGCLRVEDLKGCDFALVFGGDGSIISTARNLSRANVPVIGVNLGKLGFLAEFSLGELKEQFEDIVRGKVAIERRMMLRCIVLSNGEERFRSTAINDVFIAAGPPFSAIELKMSVDGQPLAGCVGDGVVICTPTGSTAYNLSSGGPILSPKIEAMVITPICPHSLSFRPIVISSASNIEVFGVRVNRGTTVSIDGQFSLSLSVGDVVRVDKESSEFLVVNNPVRSQWDTLATKLSWAEQPKYKGPQYSENA
ncbi:MAG: NAD(+)/NADH kinase [Phycisphaerales bacterium]|nr:MAG: NAD(+)/NADH kinase [Phycisphaerales bacterium]